MVNTGTKGFSMTKINEQAIWETGISKVTTETPVLGFNSEDNSDGPANIQAQQLANRTIYLRNLIQSMPDFREYTFYISDADPDGTIAGLLATTNGQLFRVAQGISAESTAFIYYRNVLGVAKEIASTPSSIAVSTLNQLIQRSDNVKIYETLRDEEGGILRRVTSTETSDPQHVVRQLVGKTSLGGDQEGGTFIYDNGETTRIGALAFRYSPLAGVRVIDSEGAILQDLSDPGTAPVITPSPSPSLLDDGVFFGSGIIASIDHEPVSIHIPSMLSDRVMGRDVMATTWSPTTSATSSGYGFITVPFSDYGPIAELNLCSRHALDNRKGRKLTVVNVPRTTEPKTIKILVIGDSIGNRQGPQLIAQYLTANGYTPVFIGTLHTSSVATNANDANGPLAECREGWETGDFTYSVTDRAKVILPGDEQAYLEASKSVKWPQNPIIRVATASDAPDIIRNGMVMDFEFYVQRFGLEVPDIVINALGTNDVRDIPTSDIHAAIYDNDRLMHSRILAAWPAVKILRMLPGTEMSDRRNGLWTEKYIPMLRAMGVAATGHSRVTVVPTWALVNHDGGYTMTFTALDPDTGFYDLASYDAVHPVGSSRLALYKSLTPYIVAAALNLI
jgi:hypothetical protein